MSYLFLFLLTISSVVNCINTPPSNGCSIRPIPASHIIIMPPRNVPKGRSKP
jgi:hypothetical protein